MNRKIYLIADASEEFDVLHLKLEQALSSGVDRLQIFNTEGANLDQLFEIKKLCRFYHIPLLIYNNISIFETLEADGIHFDAIPADFNKKQKILGVTVGNDVSALQQAYKLGADYISFCSVFPTRSATACELVNREIISLARDYYDGEIFLAGGISEENLDKLTGLDFDGVAMISEIMRAEDIGKKINNLKTKLSAT